MTLEELKSLGRPEAHRMVMGLKDAQAIYDLAEAMVMLEEMTAETGETTILSGDDEGGSSVFGLELDGVFHSTPAEAIRAAHEEWRR